MEYEYKSGLTKEDVKLAMEVHPWFPISNQSLITIALEQAQVLQNLQNESLALHSLIGDSNILFR